MESQWVSRLKMRLPPRPCFSKKMNIVTIKGVWIAE
jgi:hypothetical protein